MMHHQYRTDETLVLLTLAGDQDAYEELVVRHQGAVIASADQITHSRFMAEDAAQDAFVTAWMKLNTLEEPGKFRAWVCRIARNCALNMRSRYRSYLDYGILENVLDDPMQNPAELYVFSEEKEEIHQSIEKLPKRVGEIIRLHYFDGLSIAEIADRMRISEGTVKWQLHDGRKRIRKELCAMNERYGDTLVERVMKKVEELKLWQYKKDKSGFAEVYREVLREVEELPESGDKHRALADVLMRGWWWLPGEKNDALFARIREAAICGKNDEVMEFIVTREDSRVWGSAKIDFIRDKQIPMLEKAGFVRPLGREWFWLGYYYFDEKQPEKGREAFDRVLQVLNASHPYHAMVPGARRMEELLAGEYRDKKESQYRIGGAADELRYVNGRLYYWDGNDYGKGYINSVDGDIDGIFRNSARCDGLFFDESLAVGETVLGSDGASLTRVSDHETADTPAGLFADCQLWVSKFTDKYIGRITVKNWYKAGVGIVRHEHTVDDLTDVRVLKAYHIAGGTGLLPLAAGNTWEYADTYNPASMRSHLIFSVAYADDGKAIIASENRIERLKYDENSWLDMIEEIRNEYCTQGNHQKICDVSHAVERAEALAKTPMEKAHTKAAASVARRIMATDPVFNPEHTATGHWNFFARKAVMKKNGMCKTARHYRWSFEWKSTGGMGDADTPLLYNDILGILEDAAGCIWSDEWRVGASTAVEYERYSGTVKTQIICTDGGRVTTGAGIFENCLKMTLDVHGMRDGWAYRGGKKVYYFAEGVGIVRTENEYCEGARTAVYELTAYTGTGEGYMPMADGLMRRYDALDLTDGYVGAAEYTYVANDEGEIVIFADRTGIRELPPPITQYGAIQGEVIEEQLWEDGKREESRLRHDVNNFRILLHFLGRDNRNWAAPRKAAEWGKYHIRIVEFLADGGEIPRAWLGRYWRAHFTTACALFGCKTEETKAEGYRYLERAFELFPKWEEIPDGEALEVGNDLIFGGIKLIKGKGVIELPDGTREPLDYAYLFHPAADNMYYGMTAPRGWEWFNPVRGEERFKEYIERAAALKEKYKK